MLKGRRQSEGKGQAAQQKACRRAAGKAKGKRWEHT